MTLPQITFRVVCMDCRVVLIEGDEDAPISHGLCETCYNRHMIALGVMSPLAIKPRVA